ncbi:amidohydrolase 2 [Thecamonas trahens ATCC 50062]|uniref:Amidohydrolase 2 n=1 Tax=Thecamonas trahens ATCC 50062 TaxID=461836 RepID=A0A0L0D7H2_THETB|nr:amidohydrolase 2 [Thecamonas trahens ATCC 50062]KNC47248.1 amidohydrolase 2 [Thecamonas trahens ATCC 50062]|eukprot:XP_013759591.1 amidohydrolase 2 [Thecamonas trahens ATCC 50062]
MLDWSWTTPALSALGLVLLELAYICFSDNWASSPGLLGLGLRSLIDAAAGRQAPTDGTTMDALPAASRAWLDHLLTSSGIDLSSSYDVHCHVVGLGDSGSGCCANRRFSSPCHPILKLKMWVFMAAAGVRSTFAADSVYMDRLKSLLEHFLPHRAPLSSPPGPFACLLAFDKYHTPDGAADDARSGLYTPDAYVIELAARHPHLFVPVASIHPYRHDAVPALRAAAAAGCCIVKWLPNAQGIDPSSPACAPFYAAMVELDMALLSHTGDEHTVDAGGLNNALGNPLLLRTPLDAGVKVIAAHCGSEGMALDLDAPGLVRVPAFDLWLRLMDNPRYTDRLYGDIAALTSFKRIAHTRDLLLNRRDLLPRLVYGSDYPVPAVNAVVRLAKLVDAGLLDPAAVPHLRALYAANPLTFDVASKLAIGFPARVFDTNIHTLLPRLAKEHRARLAAC